MSEVAPSRTPSARPSDGENFPVFRKRFRELVSPHVAALVLNAEGSIEHATPAGRRILEYRADEPIEPCFFTHIHSRNLYQIMRDVADMVCYGKAQARWLLRLRTGRGRWSWYRAHARNHLLDSERAIIITLRDVHED